MEPDRKGKAPEPVEEWAAGPDRDKEEARVVARGVARAKVVKQARSRVAAHAGGARTPRTKHSRNRTIESDNGTEPKENYHAWW